MGKGGSSAGGERRRTHGLEHLGGDAGAFADEAKHDLFDRRGRRGQHVSRSAGRPEGAGPPTGLDLKNDTDYRRPSPSDGGCARGGAEGASAYLLGADEVVAEAASLFLRKHHDLDGFLGETLRRWTGRDEEGSGRKTRRPRQQAHVRESCFSRRRALPERRAAARPRAPRTGSPRRGGALDD